MGVRLVGHRRCVKQLVAAALIAVVVSPVAGQPPDARNAARWYTRAVQRLDAVELTDGEWKALRGYRPESGDNPSADVRAALARLQPVFRAFQRGSRQAFSDFDLDYTQGFSLTLPHLGQLRNVAGLLSKDAMVRLHDGDAAGAAASISVLYRAGNHLADDGVIISSLVGQAIFTQADRAAQAGFDRSAFGPATSETLLNAVKVFDARDPFDVVGALENEQEFVVGWVREQYEDAGDRAWMFDELAQVGLSAQAANVVSGIMLVDQAHFDTALEETSEVMGRLVELFELDDAAAAQYELKQIAEEIRRGEHGPLAALIVPNAASVHRKMIEAQAAVADRKAMLQAIVDGTVDVATLANAAVWYLRAVEMLKTQLPQTITGLRAIADDPNRHLDDATATLFAKTGPIIETLRDGSLKPRCDFSIASNGRAPAIASYLPGLRDAVRLLHADAVRQLHQGKPGNAADRLAICFRLSAHLAGDRQLPSTLTSQVIFNRTRLLAEWGLEAFNTDHLAGMLETADMANARDPFGYLSSQSAARREIVGALRLHGQPLLRAQRTVGRLDGDRLLYMVVITSRGEIALPEAEPLSDVISLEAIALALTEVQEVRNAVTRTGDLGPIADRDVPDIGRVRERFAEAQSDLRKARVTLKR